MFKVAFWKAAFERAVKTAAQAAAVLMTQDWVGVEAVQASLATAAGAAGLGALFSLLTSIASAQVGTHGSPSLAADAEVQAAQS